MSRLSVIALGVALGMLALSFHMRMAQAQPADLIEFRRLGAVGGNSVGHFDHGPNRCYLTGVGSISCVVRAKP